MAAPLNSSKSKLTAIIALLTLAFLSTPGGKSNVGAVTTAQRTFVSGLGSDSNPCTRGAPCRTFGQAISQTSAGGEVVALDSAGYGAFSIGQAVSIVAPPGVYGGISVFSGDGIDINAGASAPITALIAGTLLALAPDVRAQQSGNPRRIQLKAGASALVLEGAVRKDARVSYVFSARAGQRFFGRLTKRAGNIGFEVTDPDGQALPEEEYDFNTRLNGTLEKTGDYKITVATFETKPSRYALSVRLTYK